MGAGGRSWCAGSLGGAIRLGDCWLVTLALEKTLAETIGLEVQYLQSDTTGRGLAGH